MKLKRLTKFLSLLLFCFFSIFLISACGGNQEIDSLTLKSLYSDTEIILPIKSDSASLGYREIVTFRSKKELSELYKVIKESSAVTLAEIFQQHSSLAQKRDGIIMHYENSDGTRNYFSLLLINRDAKFKYYNFNNMSANVFYADNNNAKRTLKC